MRAALQELDAADRGDDVESTDWLATGVSELCEHIVGVHHDGLREASPRIDGLLRTVVRVHGDGEPHLHDVKRLFDRIRAELPRVRGPHPRAAETAPLAIRHRVTATPSEASDALLPCCEAWIAEQTHRWVSGRAPDAHSQAAWLR